MWYNNAHSGRSLTKPEFWEVFSPAWNSAMVPKNIISGFRKIGIYLHNPEAIPELAMAPSQITDKKMVRIVASVLIVDVLF